MRKQVEIGVMPFERGGGATSQGEQRPLEKTRGRALPSQAPGAPP